MTRRKKIIIFSIIAILIIALIWFFVQHNKQQHVQSENGNVSSLFPFTGTNVTDYQAEPGSAAPNNNYSTGGTGTGNGNNGNGNNGNGGGGNGSGSTGVTNVLNLNDLQVGTGGTNLGLNGVGNGNNGSGNGNGSNGSGSCTGEFCPGTPCPSCLSPYYGEITLKANGVSSANLTSDGGIVELAWNVGNGATPAELNTVCTAYSSDGTWLGTKIPGQGPDTLNIPANTKPGIISTIYTLTCTGIGSATATMNESSALSNGVIVGSSIKINASYGTSLNKQSVSLPSIGGTVSLSWTVVLPASYHGDPIVSCTASSSAGDWTPASKIATSTMTSTGNVLVDGNTSDNIVSNTYTINCSNVGVAIATVNVDSLTHGGIIAGSAIKITASYGTTINRQSIGLPSAGGNVGLSWTVTLPTSYAGTPVVACNASSSANDWSSGPTIATSTMTATGNVSEAANTGTSIISNTYTITCDHVGTAIATVNISPVNGNGVLGIIPGSSISISAGLTPPPTKQSVQVPANGGTVYLSWNAILPATYTGGPLACSAISSANDWTGGASMPATISASQTSASQVTEPANNGNDSISNTYTVKCDGIGQATAVVYVSSLLSGGIIKGSSITLTVATSTSAISPRSSIMIDSAGGNVYLQWKATLPAAYAGTPVVACNASSSANDWSSGPTIATSTMTATGNVIEPANGGSDVATYTYTIKCDNIGSASATVNVKPSQTSFGIINDYFTLQVDSSFSEILSSDGGPVTLSWAIFTENVSPTNPGTIPLGTSTTISNPNGPTCTASSTAGDWSGVKQYQNDGTGSEGISIPPNTSTSTQTRTYALSCNGLGVKTVTVNTNISPYSNSTITPVFQLTVEGGKQTTVAPGTPVELDWEVENIDANSCKGTSTGTTTDGSPDGPYSGWGISNIRQQDPLTSLQISNLASWNAQLLADQNNLNILLATSTVATTTATSTITTQIQSTTNQLVTNRFNVSNLNTQMLNTQSNISVNAGTISNLNTQINTNKTLLNSLNSHLQALPAPGLTGLALDAIPSLDYADTQTQIDSVNSNLTVLNNNLATVNSTQAALNTTYAAQATNLNDLQAQNVSLQGDLSVLQSELSDTQTQAQIASDVDKVTQIQNLQYQIATLQAEIDTINNRPWNIVSSTDTGGTIKEPFFDVGAIATSFSETVGADNSLSGGLLDIPITGSRKYTLTCGNLPPQSVTINVDSTQGNNQSTTPTLEFLGNGLSTPTISVGDTVDLTWKVSNIAANSCVATSDGKYDGWGYSYQKVRHVKKADGTIVDGSTYVLQPGDFEFFTNDLLADPGGTPKAPTSDVGTDVQSFTETVGTDTPISSARTYTLTCGSLTQSVTINVDNKPVLSFLVDGSTSDVVSTGATADLTWEVKNVKAGSCKGTSTGFTGVGAGGNFPGWGSDYIINQPKNLFNGQQEFQAGQEDQLSYDVAAKDTGGDTGAPTDVPSGYNADTAPVYQYGVAGKDETAPGGGGGATAGRDTQNGDLNAQFQQQIYSPKAQFYIVSGGTTKAPSTDVGGVTQKFTETIGQDGSIMDGIERDYTLQCASLLDGSPVFQTVVINGPGGITTDPSVITPNNPLGTSSNPCDNDLDIKTAQIGLTNLLATYKTLTGYTIGNYGNGSATDDPSFYDPRSPNYLQNSIISTSTLIEGALSSTSTLSSDQYQNSKDSSGLIDECRSETTRDPTNASNSAVALPYVFEDDLNTIPTTNSLTRELYDSTLIATSTIYSWLNPWPVDGALNPLQGWDWADYAQNDWHNYYAWDSGNGLDGTPYNKGDNVNHANVPDSYNNHQIWVGDLADQIIILPQHGTEIGRMWLSDGGSGGNPLFFDSSINAGDDEFNSNKCDGSSGSFAYTDGTHHSWRPDGSNYQPMSADLTEKGVDDTSNPNYSWEGGSGGGTVQNKDANNIYFYLKRWNTDPDYSCGNGRDGKTGGSGGFVSDAKTLDPGANSSSGTGGFFDCTPPSKADTSQFAFPSGSWFGSPLCGPGIIVGKYVVGADQARVDYSEGGFGALGKYFGY